MPTAPLLFEIGCEELPSSYVDAALAALPALVTERLAALRLAHGEVLALGSPRRLALLVHGVADRQTDLDEEVVGPPETAAFKDGQPTKAAEAFAQKLGVPVTSLSVVDKAAEGKQKAGRFVVGRRAEKGVFARELLGRALVEVAGKIPFRKSMRWGAGEATFGRPVQWIVALFGADVVDLEFAAVRSGRTSRGHRFLAPATFELASAGTYVDALRERHVLVDRKERERTMMDRVEAAARAASGAYDPEAMLVSENASLVEEPHVVTGRFADRFLALPAAVIRAVARGHQRYFVLSKDDETLLSSYLAVVNTANDPARIQKGVDRVMTARLSDAEFFFAEDKKVAIEDRVEKLTGIVFHARLGTVREKVTRIERLAGILADRLGLSAELRTTAARAAHLAKFDLVSLMVSEFPELQGHMGRIYATHFGESATVADAVRDHYRPVGATDDLPVGDVSRIIALADRLDTLAGCFAIGLSPTGTADPFALRRAAIAALRFFVELGESDPRWAALSPLELFGDAYDGFEGKKLELAREDAIRKIGDFASERLRGLLAQRTSSAAAEAVLSGTTYIGGKPHAVVDRPAHALWKCTVLDFAVKEGKPWLSSARTVAKRLSGISKSQQPKLHDEAAFAGQEGGREKNGPIVTLVTALDAATQSMNDRASVEKALAALPEVATGLEAIFEKILVNDPNDPLTERRLELLSYGASCIARVADFSRLEG